MKVYFDIKSLISFIHSAKDPRYSDCIRMIKDNIELVFAFAVEDVDALSKDDNDDYKTWLRTMDSLKYDISRDYFWDDKIKKEELDISHSYRLESVYCLSEDKVIDFRDHSILLMAKEGNELATISSLLMDGNQYSKNIFRFLESWDDLHEYILPCTDIIVVDKYLLSSPDMYRANLYKIIDVLSSFAIDYILNIVIFVPPKVYDKKTKTTFVPDWDDVYSEIRRKTKKKYKPNVTFVVASDDVLEEHDRTIFTNYRLFDSGDTFNYFLITGEKVTRGRNFHVNSKADTDIKDDSGKFIKDMQGIINELVRTRRKDLIMKDKVSNFLTFPE